MPDRPPSPWLARLLPASVRCDMFEPALQDLRVAALRRRAQQLRPFATVRHAAAVAGLFLSCWRAAILGLATREASTLPPDPVFRRRPVTLFHDLRLAARALRRQPLFTLAAVLTLALGVGANVAVFAVVEAVILRPLPYPNADDLFVLRHRDDRTGITKEFIAVGDYIDLAARQQRAATLAAYGGGQVTVTADGDPFLASALLAGPGLLDTLRVARLHGRLLDADDAREGAAPVVALGYDRWMSSFGGDPDVIGRRIRVGQTDREIVGVVAEGFRFPPSATVDVILPLTLPATAPAARKSGWLFVIGRLAPGVTLEAATREFTALSEQFEREYPSENLATRYYGVSLADELVGATRPVLWLLAGAVAVVLLIACANVGNLLLARALGRRQELAVQMALGAGRWRVLQQLLAESLVLAMLAGTAGILAAHWTVPALVSLVPPTVTAPGLEQAGVNGPVLVFALALVLATTVGFALVAAWTLRRQGTAGALLAPARVTGSAATRRMATALVIAEVALAVVLLMGAGLIVRTFGRLLAVDPGFRTEHVLLASVSLPPDRYPPGAARSLWYQQAFDAIRAVPGVTAVGSGAVTPLTGNNWTTALERADRRTPAGQRPPDVGWQTASGGFFDALQIPVRSGRAFDGRDLPGSPPVVIVSESIERLYFRGESAVGRRVVLGNTEGEIVGVVGDIRRASLTDEPRADMYFPFERQPGIGTTLFIRTSSDAAALRPAVERTLRSLEPQVVIGNVTTLDHVAAESVAVTTFALWLLGAFSVIALALSAVGIYGVMSYAVRQRTREIGTRVALGASPRDITWLVVRQGGTMAAVGLVAGLLAGLLSGRVLQGLLYDVSATDPAALAGAVGLLFVTALAACYLPARRAARVDAARTLSGM